MIFPLHHTTCFFILLVAPCTPLLAKEDKYSGFAEILPWTDTDIAIKEVGTIIDDIKTMGDAAIEKWKQD